MLAEHFARLVREGLENEGGRLTAVEVEVEETIGQSGTYRMAMGD